MAGEKQELSIVVTARDLASRTLGKVNKSLSSIGGHARRGVAEAAHNLTRLGIVATAATAAAGIGVVKMAASWESAAAGVAKTIDGDITDILDGLVAMSNRMPVAANELAAIAEAAGALGVAREDILAFTEVAALLAVTTDVSSEQAATALGHLQTTLGLTGRDYEQLGSALVDLGNNGASTESQILGMAERVAGAARLVRLGKAETLGWAAALANTGMEVEAGGSALQRFFLGAFQDVSKGGEALKVYARTAGMSGRAFEQTMRRDFSGAMERFMVGLGKLDEASRLNVLDELGFTDIRITRAILGLAGNTDNLTDSLSRSGKAWRDNTAMTEEADKRFRTFDSRLGTLRNNLQNAAVTIGNKVLPGLSKIAAKVTGFLQRPEVQAALKRFGDDLAVKFDELVVKAEAFLATVDWEGVAATVGEVARLTGEIVGKAIGLFASAPPWLKVAVLTGWGLNKLTGGAFGSIVGELGKGLIRGVLGITAGVVNVMAASVRGGPGAPGVAPVGKPPAGPSRAAKVGGALGILALPFLVESDSSGRGLAGGIGPADVSERLKGIDARLVELKGNDSENARNTVFLLELQRQALVTGNTALADRIVDGTHKLADLRAGLVPEVQAMRRGQAATTARVGDVASGVQTVRSAIVAQDLSVTLQPQFSFSVRDINNAGAKQTVRTRIHV